jgi:serine/threonine-protein kinase
VPSPDGSATQATIATSIMPHQQQRSRRRVLPWMFAAAGVLAAIAVWVTRPPSAPQRPAGGQREAATEPRPAEQPSTPPVAPAASVERPVAEAVSPLPPVEAPAESASTSASAAPPKLAFRKAGTSPPIAARAKNCNPPYRIDASGVRRVKPECL